MLKPKDLCASRPPPRHLPAPPRGHTPLLRSLSFSASRAPSRTLRCAALTARECGAHTLQAQPREQPRLCPLMPVRSRTPPALPTAWASFPRPDPRPAAWTAWLSGKPWGFLASVFLSKLPHGLSRSEGPEHGHSTHVNRAQGEQPLVPRPRSSPRARGGTRL